MLKVAAGYARCQGYANCIMAGPDVSGFDGEQGVVVLGEAVRTASAAASLNRCAAGQSPALSEQLAD